MISVPWMGEGKWAARGVQTLTFSLPSSQFLIPSFPPLERVVKFCAIENKAVFDILIFIIQIKRRVGWDIYITNKVFLKKGLLFSLETVNKEE